MKWLKLENVNKLINLDFIEYIVCCDEEECEEDEQPFQMILYVNGDSPHNISYARKSWRDRDFLEICSMLEGVNYSLAYLTGDKSEPKGKEDG